MRRILFILLALYVVVGCGGGGSSTGTSPTLQTRDSVKEGVAHSIMGVAQAGIYGASGTTGGTGGGIGFPMIGPFLYQFLPPAGGSPRFSQAMRHHSRVASTGGETSTGGTGSGTDGGGGGGDQASFYFDDYLGVWVDMSSTDTSYSLLLYVDEAKTQSAGSFISTFPSGWNTYPYSLDSNFEITAGTLAGAHGHYSTSVESEDKGHNTFESVWPAFGSDSGESTWDGGSGTWHYQSTVGDHWWKGDGSFSANGGGTSSFSDSAGYKASYVYHFDGSGTGRIEGPDPGLPATITWTSSGHVKIVYADGTVEEWDPNDYFEGGTTGSDGGTTGTVTSGSETSGTETTGSQSTGSGGTPLRRGK